VYYLYMKESAEGFVVETIGDVFSVGALAISMIAILLIGIYPTPLFNVAGAAARAFLQQ
jgi:hypothetical protein